jgi:hypothetical protein
LTTIISTNAVPELLIAPYVPLGEAAAVGPWELIPFRSVAESDALPDALRRPVLRLVEAYDVSGSATMLGVVAYPGGGHIGAAFVRATMRRLGHALLAGAVASNPRMAIPENEQSPNAGHEVAAAENALLYGHPLDGGDSYVVETGMLARVMDLRHAPGEEPLPKIAPPVELPKPLFPAFDIEIADATHAALGSGDSPARRLGRAIDWYKIALSNSVAVTLDVRVGAARSALEVLTGAGDETKRLVRAYGDLCRTDTTPQATYDNARWAKGPVQLTPDEWWVTRLCELRNAIVHGDEVSDELWRHDGHHQLNHIHDRLIDALSIVVADRAGDPLLRLPRRDRLFSRRVHRTEEVLSEPNDPPPDPEPGPPVL